MRREEITYPNGLTEVINHWESEEEEANPIADGKVPGWGPPKAFPAANHRSAVRKSALEESKQGKPEKS